MRRLPVIQPTAFERRAFLLGVVATIAACASESESGPAPKRGTSSGGPGTTSPTDGGGSPSGDGGDGGGPGPVDPLRDSGSDAPADAAPSGCTVSGVDAGPPGSFAMGTLTYLAGAGAYVGRDAGGLYAMYALCTHTVGNLQVSATQLTCLVHGARFSLTGAVLQGPATMPLPHFSICLNSKGNVAVDSKVIVPSTTRLSA